MIRIVTFCNRDYIPVLITWYLALKRIGLEHHALVITLDEETFSAVDFCDAVHRPLALQGGNFGALWQHRLEVLEELLMLHDQIIHSDADAVWLRNPLPMISGLNSDIVFSQGTIWPYDVHALYGLVLCCGLFYLNNSAPSREFFKAVKSRVIQDRDDQIAVNREVATRIAGWQIDEPYHIPFRDTHFTTSKHVIRSIAEDGEEDLNICVLPHHFFPRLINSINDDVYVAHPLSGKTLEEKVQCLSALGLWWYSSDD